MAHVVKLFTNDYGEKYDNPQWHYVHENCGGAVAFCSGEYFGAGESGCEYKDKEGKITCPDCIALIKTIKTVKL